MRKLHQNVGYLMASITAIACVLGGMSLLAPSRDALVRDTSPLTPWQSVGGCGAGGSGGGGAGKAKWIGMGVVGNPVELEAMLTMFTGQNFRSISLTPRVGYALTYTDRIGLTVPYVSNTGVRQPATNFEPEEGVTTGGLADISLDYSKMFGMSGEFSFSLGLSLPTGQYDIRRGSDKVSYLLPQNLQKGTGVYSPSLGLSYSGDITDDVMLLFDIGYSHPFALSFTGKNNKVYYPDDYPDSAYNWPSNSTRDKKRFDYVFKPYGENDLGAYFPPGFSFGAYWAYRGIPNFVHSLGATFSFPIGVAWIAYNDQVDLTNPIPYYNPKPDPDNQAWGGSIVYGVQCSKLDWLPLFFAITLPIHDQTAQNAKTSPEHWDAPDWKDFGQQLKLSLGMKAGFF